VQRQVAVQPQEAEQQPQEAEQQQAARLVERRQVAPQVVQARGLQQVHGQGPWALLPAQ